LLLQGRIAPIRGQTMHKISMIVTAALLANAAAAMAQTAAPAAETAPAQTTGTGTAPSLTEVVRKALITSDMRAAAAMGTSSLPTFDEGSAQRIGEAIDRYTALAAKGGWPAIPADAKFAVGTAGANDALLRQRLIVSGDLAADKASGGFDDTVVEGLKHFQTRHGLVTTGNVGPRTLAALNVPVQKRIQQLEASRERIKQMGFGFGPRYVVVNIPAAYAEAVENNVVVKRYRVIVGKTEKPSPTLTAEISNVNLNPTWTVPSSITKNEIAAHMRKDPTYLTRMHMQILDSKEAVIDPATVDWSQTPNFTVRQVQGEWNALGQVRIDMPNNYAVYMHDTNQKHLFQDDYRFDSHGCARIENVRDLAAWVLQDMPKWDRAAIDAKIATGERETIKLPTKIPVAWTYLTGWMTSDKTINFRNDIYDQDTQLMEATNDVTSFFKQASERSAK
jgi:murein L,D-transpeptidase YcbB/YkuD